MSDDQHLSVQEELSYLYEIYGQDQSNLVFDRVIASFDILQTRASILLSLMAICLTVSGFSGPQIAASSTFCRMSIILGIGGILLSALILLLGPLQLRWGTRVRRNSLDESLVRLLEIRNRRTQMYHRALGMLMLGLTGYVASVIGYLGIL